MMPKDKIDDGGGPGKRGGPFTLAPPNFNFGTPPAYKAEIWARRKAEHKAPVEVARLVREIGGLAKQLKRQGVDTESIRQMVSEIAVIDRFEHLDILSVQALERIKKRFSDKRDLQLRQAVKTFDLRGI